MTGPSPSGDVPAPPRRRLPTWLWIAICSGLGLTGAVIIEHLAGAVRHLP